MRNDPAITTKRELLLFVVDHPGADPGASRELHEWADELISEGWILEAMGGFEPTAKALDEHPAFASQEDIRHAEASVVPMSDDEIIRRLADGEDPWTIDPEHGCINPLTGYFPAAEIEREKERRLAVPETTTEERMALMFVVLMSEVPLKHLYAAVGMAWQLELHPTAPETAMARELTRRLTEGP